MKLVIMQPYLFPYLGYIQLIQVADTFVIYDDAQFMKGGWINRNRILGGGGPQFITLNLKGASANKAINEVHIGDNRVKLRKTIEQTYAKAPFQEEGMAFVDECFDFEGANLARFIGNSLILLAKHLQLPTKFVWASELDRDRTLAAQDAVLNMCEMLGATHYINAEGGKELYSQTDFRTRGIQLSFLLHQVTEYKQARNKSDFEARLSIIDALMNIGFEGVKAKLKDYDLVEG